jgi:hypothetical protein
VSSIVTKGNGIVFLGGEDGDDMRLVERGDGLRFPSEARQPSTIRM